jgi:hypothetical protein
MPVHLKPGWQAGLGICIRSGLGRLAEQSEHSESTGKPKRYCNLGPQTGCSGLALDAVNYGIVPCRNYARFKSREDDVIPNCIHMPRFPPAALDNESIAPVERDRGLIGGKDFQLDFCQAFAESLTHGSVENAITDTLASLIAVC